MSTNIGIYYGVYMPYSERDIVLDALSKHKDYAKLAKGRDLRIGAGRSKAHIGTTANADADPSLYLIFVDEMTIESDDEDLPFVGVDPAKMEESLKQNDAAVKLVTDIHEYLVEYYATKKLDSHNMQIGWVATLCEFDDDDEPAECKP